MVHFIFLILQEISRNCRLENVEIIKEMKAFLLSAVLLLPLCVNARETALRTDTVMAGSAEPRIQNVVTKPDKWPSFPGGLNAMTDFIRKKMKYPKKARKAGIDGHVMVKFVVNCDGSISDIGIHKPADPDLNAEAMRIASIMPKWTPGIYRGQVVPVRYLMPVTFRLSNEEKESGLRYVKIRSRNKDVMINPVNSEEMKMMPSFPGGGKALKKFLDNNLDYPDVADRKSIHGRVVVRFTVGEDGSISGIEVVESVHPTLDKEVVRVVKSMPKWNPGMENGQPVSRQVFLPVNFNMEHDKSKWKDGKKNGHYDFDTDEFFHE